MTRLCASSLLLCAILLFAGQPLQAQSRPANRPAARAPARNPVAVRAELAALLLQSKRYQEAAREYAALVAREPANNTYRLGLARALAWGNRPREAERELRILAARRPNDREIDALLRSVRASFEPGSDEADSWLAQRPTHAPYRLALARALVREGSPGEALPHYEKLIALDNSAPLRREAIDAYIAAGESDRAASLLRTTLQRTAADTAARHTLARVLTDLRQYDDALAQYDTLVAWYPLPNLLVERAQLHVARRDLNAAEADATAAVRARQNADAYLLLSGLQRRRGDLVQARISLERAALLNPDERTYDAARAQQEREERPIIAFMPAWDYGAGLTGRSSVVSDNLGLLYTTVGAHGSTTLAPSLTGSVDLELRRMAEPSADLDQSIVGVALNAGLSHEVGYGPLLVRIGARGGFAQQVEQAVPTFALAASGWFRAWGLSLEHTRAPAYPTLFSVATIRSPDTDDVLTERSTSITAGGPLAHVDAALYAQRAQISDGNTRNTLQAVLRLPLAPPITAVASITSIRFAQRSSLYWDPLSYLAAAAGLELAIREPRGVSFAVRALAGPARSVESFEDPESEFEADEVERTALQLSGGAELNYRSETSELGAALAYGTGRAGDYRRLEATLYIRRLR